jgi:hypothetical protein
MIERLPKGVERAWRLGSIAALALLSLACEGDNLFQPGGGFGVGAGSPSVDIQEPRDPAANPVGDSVFVSAAISDDFGVDSVVFEGFAIRGDPALGTETLVPRFEAKMVPLGAVQDTVISRFLVPTPDSTRETAAIVVTAYDASGNASADTLSMVMGGPRVRLMNIETGQRVQAGLALAIGVDAVDPEGIIQVVISATGAFQGEIVQSFSPPVDSVVVDTSFVIPAGITGNIELTATARSTVDVSGQDGPVTVVAVTGSTADSTQPLARLVTAAPDRMELGDTVTVEVIGRDNTQGSGVQRVGYTVRGISPTRGDTIILSEERLFVPARTGIVSETFKFAPFNVDSLALPDTMVYQITGYVVDNAANCSAAIPSEELATVDCLSLPSGETVADGPSGDIMVRPVVAGRTVRLADGGRILDAAVDTTHRNLFLSNLGRDRVEVFRLQEEIFLPPIAVGSEPWGLWLNRGQDTLLVANSGGTNITNVFIGPSSAGPTYSGPFVEDAGRRLLTPDVVFFDVERALDESGGLRYTAFVIPDATPPGFSDRPQYLAVDSVGRVLYSTKTTLLGDVGTIRKAFVPPGQTDVEVVVFYEQGRLIEAPDFVAIANVDDVAIRLSTDPLNPNDDEILLFDHIPGDRSSSLTGGPGTPTTAVADLAGLGSDVVAGTGRWDIASLGFSDTTFVSASGDGGWVVFGEGSTQDVGRVMMYDAGNDQISDVVQVTDLMTNASETVRGIGLNHDGTLGLARGDVAYFFSTDLRLQGVSDIPPGGSGAALHPLHADYPSLNNPGGRYDPDVHVAFIGAGDATIEIVDAFHFNSIGRLFIRDVITGPLKVSLPFVEDNAGLACQSRQVFNGNGQLIGEAIDIFSDLDGQVPYAALGGPTEDLCVVAKLYGVTDEGVVVVDVRKGDILRNHPSRMP